MFSLIFYPMDYPINLPGFSEQKLVWRTATWKNSFLYNGEVVKGEGKKKNEFRLKDDNGEEKLIVAHSSFGDSVPVIEFGGERVQLVPPISTGQKVLSGLLFAPLLAGGAIGGLFAGIGWGMSLGHFRSESPVWLQYAKVLGSAAVAWFVYLLLAGGIHSMIN